MLKIKNNLINATKVRSVVNDTVKIDSGSVVFDGKWVSYKSVNYRISDYITGAVVPPRTRFFTNRDYAVMLVVGLDNLGTLKTIEGSQVKYTTNDAVPAPSVISIIPLVGIILIQDGTNNLESFKTISDQNIVTFNGSGNIKAKNVVGIQGATGVDVGATGYQGPTGLLGYGGSFGYTGYRGVTGIDGLGMKGETGVRGLTGINWTIHLPFETLN